MPPDDVIGRSGLRSCVSSNACVAAMSDASASRFPPFPYATAADRPTTTLPNG